MPRCSRRGWTPTSTSSSFAGAGEKFFCAGANIGMLKDADPDFKYYFCLHANETLTRLEQTPKLVIAALNGHTVGGGLEVAMAADIRIAKKDARQDRPAGSRARRAARHRRHAAAGAAGRQGPGDRADGDRPADVDGRGEDARHRHRGLGRGGAERAQLRTTPSWSTRGSSRRRTRRAARWAG